MDAGNSIQTTTDGTVFEDLGGMGKIIEEMKEELFSLLHPEVPSIEGLPMRAILLLGLPGCGKTKLVYAMANHCKLPFYRISATEVVSRALAPAKTIRDLFSIGYESAPSIVFIDEIDAIASRKELRTQLFTCMNDTPPSYVLVIGATNNLEVVDDLMGPGSYDLTKFDEKFQIGPPDLKARVEILFALSRKHQIAGDVDFEKIAKATGGFVGADLAALINEAEAGNVAVEDLISKHTAHASGSKSSRLYLIQTTTDETVFEDLGGMGEILEAMKKELRALIHPEVPCHLGLFLRAILLLGLPGCGKTKLVYAMANHCKLPFYRISATEVVSRALAPEKTIRDLFSIGYDTAPSIVFIDEIDAIASRTELRTQLFTCMDNMPPSYVLVIGATSKLEVVDDLIGSPRSGLKKFGKKFLIGPPNRKARVEILSALSRKLPVAGEVDFEEIAEATKGCVGADLAALIYEAGEVAIADHISKHTADASGFKLVLSGDSGVGKSCIALRFVNGQVDPASEVTFGVTFFSQTIALQDSTTVKFDIWDTTGQERYAALAPLYYRGTAVAVVVYDITSAESFSKAQYWVKELRKHGGPDIVMALVGNKADLCEKRKISIQDGTEFAEKNRMFFIETSAKTAENIIQLFEELGKRLTPS